MGFALIGAAGKAAALADLSSRIIQISPCDGIIVVIEMDGAASDLIVRSYPCLVILAGGRIQFIICVSPGIQVGIVMGILKIAPELEGVADLLVDIHH